MRAKIFFIVSIFIMILVAGCGGQNETAKTANNFCTVTDDSGREITLDKKPARVVTVSASFLEPLHAVGLDVVGRPSSKYEIPEYAKDAAEIGAVYQIDTEKLLACQPDLVIINKGMNERLGDLLTENKINFFVADMKGYDSVKKILRRLHKWRDNLKRALKLFLIWIKKFPILFQNYRRTKSAWQFFTARHKA